MIAVWLALVVASPPLPSSTESSVVLAIDASPELAARMLRIQDWSSATSGTVLSDSDWLRRLTGLTAPSLVDVTAAQRKLREADDCEASFEQACAQRLREEVLAAYENSLVPDRQLQKLVATALHDAAAGELAEGRRAEALAYAKTAYRRFPGVPIDANRHPPAVSQLFTRAAIEHRSTPRSAVTFRTNRPGRLAIDGTVDTPISNDKVIELPVGGYRAWIIDGANTSLVHEVTVTTSAMTVVIDFETEKNLRWTPVARLACSNDCDDQLRALARLVGVDRAIGVKMPSASDPAQVRIVPADKDEAYSSRLAALDDLLPIQSETETASPIASYGNFSPWSLVPLGVGQFRQGRYVAGGIYAGLQLGVIAWHAAASSRSGSYDGPNPAVDESRRDQRNISGTVLIGALVASVAEALIVDAVAP